MSEPTAAQDGYEILAIDDLDRETPRGGSPLLLPLRQRLGFRPFGLNCWTADTAGAALIGPHGPSGVEKLYVVLRGLARVTLDGREFDAPVGTLIHAPPGSMCEAVATEPGTIVLEAGAKPGEAFAPEPSENPPG